MTRSHNAIIAYGKADDRAKLAAIAKSEGSSGSQVIINHIRARYTELFGDLPVAAAS